MTEMVAEKLTERQRTAVAALEAARQAGMTLSDYAKAQGLEVRPVYDAIAALRRRGALPGSDRPRKRRSKSRFVAGTGDELVGTGDRDCARRCTGAWYAAWCVRKGG